MYKILEQNGIDNENIDGGAFNNFAAGGRDGIVGGVLSECTITATGSVVAIAPGLLMIHGIRVKIEEIETIAIMSVPLRPTSYQLVGQVIVSSKNNVEFSVFIRSPQELAQSNFYTSGEGTYQVELASFVHNPDGSISDLVRTVDIIYGGAGGGTNIEVGNVVTETLPAETDAEFDVTVRNPAGTNKTLLDFTAKIPKGASGTDEGAVHFNEVQSLSEQQKAQARENIDAASTSGMHPNMSVGYASAASCDENGNNIDSTYAQKNGICPELTAGAAEKAIRDGNGDIIASTYAKQNGSYPNLTAGLATKANTAPNTQGELPNGDNSDKVATTGFVAPQTIYNGTTNYDYRGKSYSISKTSTPINFSVLSVNRAGNVVTISGWGMTNASVSTSAYALLNNLPRSISETYGTMTFAAGTSANMARVFIQPGATTLYMATNFTQGGNAVASGVYVSFEITYMTDN